MSSVYRKAHPLMLNQARFLPYLNSLGLLIMQQWGQWDQGVVLIFRFSTQNGNMNLELKLGVRNEWWSGYEAPPTWECNLSTCQCQKWSNKKLDDCQVASFCQDTPYSVAQQNWCGFFGFPDIKGQQHTIPIIPLVIWILHIYLTSLIVPLINGHVGTVNRLSCWKAQSLTSAPNQMGPAAERKWRGEEGESKFSLITFQLLWHIWQFSFPLRS